MTREAARLEVRRAVEEETQAAFAKRAKIDPGTLADFLAGIRWPQGPTRRKIERALGWPDGRITDLAEGRSAETVGPAAPSVLEAIRADPHLLPEAKEHLLRQYGLLLRVQADPAAEHREQTEKELREHASQTGIRLVDDAPNRQR